MTETDRRTLLGWSAAVATMLGLGWGATKLPSGAPLAARAEGGGYGIDPPLVEPRRQPWPSLLTGTRARGDLAVLIDRVVPGVDGSPPGTQVGLPLFFDEWLSAPYPAMRDDRALIGTLLSEIAGLADHQPETQARIVAELPGGPVHAAFARFSVLAAAAYHTTPAGIAALGFVGNEPRASFDGPPQAVLDHFNAAFAKLRFDHAG